MYFLEVVALLGFFGIVAATFTGTVGSCVWLLHSVVRGYFDYLERELDMRRFEAASRVDQARAQSSIPVWVDRDDPTEVAAWNRAVAETWRISAASARRLTTS